MTLEVSRIKPAIEEGISFLRKKPYILRYSCFNKLKVSPESERFSVGLVKELGNDCFGSARLSEFPYKITSPKTHGDVFQLNSVPTISGISAESTDSAESILQKYMGKLDHFDGVSDVKILYNKNMPEEQFPAFLLKKPMEFKKALDFLSSKIKEFRLSNPPFDRLAYHDDFELFKEAIENGGIPNISIKGIIGQGKWSTAFLTSDNKVIKLSSHPHFPAKEHFIEGLDVPIYDRYIVPVSNGKTIYGATNPLTKVGFIKFNPLEVKDLIEYGKSWDILDARLTKENKTKGKYYCWDDFCKSKKISTRQMGFIGDKGYLLDSACVWGRPLAT